MKFNHYQNKMKFQKFLKRITFVILLLPIISIMSQGQTSTKNAPDPHITECKVDNFLKFNSNSKSKYKNGIACWYKNDELKLEFTIQRSAPFIPFVIKGVSNGKSFSLNAFSILGYYNGINEIEGLRLIVEFEERAAYTFRTVLRIVALP